MKKAGQLLEQLDSASWFVNALTSIGVGLHSIGYDISADLPEGIIIPLHYVILAMGCVSLFMFIQIQRGVYFYSLKEEKVMKKKGPLWKNVGLTTWVMTALTSIGVGLMPMGYALLAGFSERLVASLYYVILIIGITSFVMFMQVHFGEQ